MPLSSMRVLFVVNNPDFFLSHRLPLADAVRALARVEVAGPPGPGTKAVEELGYAYHVVPMARTGVNPLRDLVTLASLVRLFRACRPDLVHLITIKPVLYGGLAARLAGVPATVAAFTGLGYALISEDFSARAIRLAVRPMLQAVVNNPRARVILQNDDDARVLAATVRSCEPRLRVVRGSGVDPHHFAPLAEPGGDPVVLFAGRLLRDKGLGDFVEAARIARDGNIRARFVVAGEPDPLNPTSIPEETIREWQAAGLIEWWGHRADMPAVFAASHIVCLPTTYGEGVPKVLIEAAACGRAIVASDWPGCRDIVDHGLNGLLVEPRNPAALAGGIRRLVENADERRQMGAAGRMRVLDEFSSAHVIRDTLAVYRELLGPAPGRLAPVSA